MRRRWTSPRSLLAHLGMVGAVGLCSAAARWQIHRAASGNLLSYAYAVEWPLFAIAGVVMWWQYLHDDRPPFPLERPEPESDTGTIPGPPAERIEDPALQSYNDELANLASRGKRKSWRNPRGLP